MGSRFLRVRLAPLALLAVCGASPMTGCDVFDRIQPGTKSLLSAFDPPSYEQAVEWALNSYDADERYRGIAMLTEAPFAGEPAYLALFRDKVTDDDAAVRQAAVRALGLHGNPDDALLIAQDLEDDDYLVRLAAAQALQKLHNPDVIDPLIAHLSLESMALRNARSTASLAIRGADGERKIAEETEPAVRAEVALALGQYRTIKVVQSLIGALSDRSLAVNHNAIKSLTTLTGQDFGYDPGLWLDWIDATPDVFAAGRAYTYPGFSRPRHPIEWLPFVPQPPKAAEAPPVGLPRDAG
jgi:hypothetical protein